MRKMGIDFGTKKVGIAFSDDSGRMAFPHGVIPNDNNFLSAVVSLIESKSVAEVVIGHSLDKEGNENKVHELVKQFITDLTLNVPVPIHLEPEQFSTQQAVKLQGRNDQTDASAAAIILQSYIDKQKTNSSKRKVNIYKC